MSDIARILIADDDLGYAQVTARFLTGEGYQCDHAPDALSAETLLEENPYDLLISDIEMPGNEDLRLTRRAAEISPGLPVILATAYPTVDTATVFARLPVFAYLVKPLDYGELSVHVSKAVSRHRLFQAASLSEKRLSEWANSLAEFRGAVQSFNSGSMNVGLQTFTSLTFGNMIGALAELRTLLEVAFQGENSSSPCNIRQCALQQHFENAMTSAIEAIRDTKGTFKSKEIAELRKKLERMLEEERRQFGRA